MGEDGENRKRAEAPGHVGEALRDILARFSARGAEAASAPTTPIAQAPAAALTTATSGPILASRPESETDPGRYDFDLAEFPLFRLYKNRLGRRDAKPLVYADTIEGRDHQQVERLWKCYPSPFGFGGATTQEVLYALLQLYVEQGCRGTQIQFGTMRALFKRMHPEMRSPAGPDFTRLRRDIDILCGYRFECKNAFWDAKRRAYVDVRQWSLFTAAYYFKPDPRSPLQEELPFGFVEASPMLQHIAKSRGFFCIGFDSGLFYQLKPLEQRLAVYLSKKFISQRSHRRFVDDLAAALPIEASRPNDVRTALRHTAQGLLDAKVPILADFRLEKSQASGRWVAVFERKHRPTQDYLLPQRAAEELAPALRLLVDDMVAATGNRDDELWWTQCAQRLGESGVYEALSELKLAKHRGGVRSPGRLLTRILKDKAQQRGILLH